MLFIKVFFNFLNSKFALSLLDKLYVLSILLSSFKSSKINIAETIVAIKKAPKRKCKKGSCFTSLDLVLLVLVLLSLK